MLCNLFLFSECKNHYDKKSTRNRKSRIISHSHDAQTNSHSFRNHFIKTSVSIFKLLLRVLDIHFRIDLSHTPPGPKMSLRIDTHSYSPLSFPSKKEKIIHLCKLCAHTRFLFGISIECLPTHVKDMSYHSQHIIFDNR